MKILLITGLLATISCTVNEKEQAAEQVEINSNLTTQKICESSLKEKDPYDINFDVDQESRQLLIQIDLDSGSYYLSPNTPGTFKGLLKVNFSENKFITINEKIHVNPVPVREENEWGEGLVDIIRQSTVHSLGYHLKTNEDFNIQGSVQFVIEPKCTLEKIPVTIYRKDGKLNFVRNCP